jgi:hypothetical protein
MSARLAVPLIQEAPLVFQQQLFDLGQIHQGIGNR